MKKNAAATGAECSILKSSRWIKERLEITINLIDWDNPPWDFVSLTLTVM